MMPPQLPLGRTAVFRASPWISKGLGTARRRALRHDAPRGTGRLEKVQKKL